MSIYNGTYLLENGYLTLYEAKESNHDGDIKKDRSVIIKEANMASKNVYETFRDKYYEKYKNSTSKYHKLRLEEIDRFYKDNTSAPKVDSIDTDDSGHYMISFNYNGKYTDIQLFFDDDIYRELKKSSVLKKLGYHLWKEDYPGIYIGK